MTDAEKVTLFTDAGTVNSMVGEPDPEVQIILQRMMVDGLDNHRSSKSAASSKTPAEEAPLADEASPVDVAMASNADDNADEPPAVENTNIRAAVDLSEDEKGEITFDES